MFVTYKIHNCHVPKPFMHVRNKEDQDELSGMNVIQDS
jgi:hypothetical protein